MLVELGVAYLFENAADLRALSQAEGLEVAAIDQRRRVDALGRDAAGPARTGRRP
jgi:hypothetical protein